jgi:hypothetical protein
MTLSLYDFMTSQASSQYFDRITEAILIAIFIHEISTLIILLLCTLDMQPFIHVFDAVHVLFKG